MDWNTVVHLLDELRDGPCSLLEFDATLSRYERKSLLPILIYLADRNLIALSETRHPFDPIPPTEWRNTLRDAFGADTQDPVDMAGVAIDLSKSGTQVLQLFGIGSL